MKINIKNVLNLFLVIFMIFFSTNAESKYKKVFFDHSIKNINGENFELNNYKNKALLLVNVASYCGFTKQYAQLQNLLNSKMIFFS